ncbi:MAG: four helix bundle protein [Thiogranum sp.]|jgi:four helix bundle protein
MYFEFEKLDVYQSTLGFIALVDQIAHQLPQGYSHRKNQLQRSADSIADNIAEGVGEYAVNERRRFLRISRRSALEAASQLLVIQRHRQADANLLEPALAALHRIVCMLTKMISATKDRRLG